MKVATRRLIVAAGGVAAAGTVAAAALMRKPDGPAVHTLLDEVAAEVGSVARLVVTEPPVAPAAAHFLDAAGAEKRLADYAGRGLVVNLWATWCVPCVAEMPELAALARRGAAEGILVLPLSSDRGGAAVVEKFYARHAIAGLPVLIDPKGAAARAWGARGLPTTLVIDRQGLERGRVEGAIDWASDATMAALRKLVG